MDIKYSKAITFFLLSLSLIFLMSFSYDIKNAERKNKLKLILTIDRDTCSYNDNLVKLSIQLVNNKTFPYFAREAMNVSSWLDNEMVVIITHKNKRYYQENEYFGRNLSCAKFMISKNKTYKRKYILNMRNLVKKTERDSINRVRNISINKKMSLYSLIKLMEKECINHPLKVDNKDWGNYQIQVKYIKSKKDTVYSNIINIIYLPK